MITNAKFLLGVCFMGLIVAGIGLYAYGQSREYLHGPQVTIREPKDGSVLSEAPVVISGNAQNIAYIMLNDASIFVDSKGDFNQKLLLLPGYNILTIEALDRFGKKVEKTLELVYKEPEKEIVASSTPLAP
ncbi:MAG: Polymorphic outer membrane protein [Parcubacteria group bacterium GW2011_GWA2_44_15]|nr:MAG: Polymorphic outer membrane protein [Parcubacteria group bacterium GW2011_GWA2_44_15]